MSSDLSTEAKKYKSAEEFVKAQPKLYHGGSADIKDIQLGKSNFQKTFYMSENPDYAKSFGGNKSSLNEIMVDSKAKLADLRKPSDDLVKQIEDIISSKPTGKTVRIQKPDGTFLEIPETKGGLSNPVHSSKDILNGIRQGKAYFAEMPEVKKALKKLGYDGMITQESKMGTNFGVWNKDILKTKSQLEEIWNKANKSSLQKATSTLEQEAKKYKSADEFVDYISEQQGFRPKFIEQVKLRDIWKKQNIQKLSTDIKKQTQQNKQLDKVIDDALFNYTNKRKSKIPDVKYYRGQTQEKMLGQKSGGADLGKGLYFTNKKSIAKQYGDVIEINQNDFPKKPLFFDTRTKFDGFLAEIKEATGVKSESQIQDYGRLIRLAGNYDGVVIGNGEIIVKYQDRKGNLIRDIWKKANKK